MQVSLPYRSAFSPQTCKRLWRDTLGGVHKRKPLVGFCAIMLAFIAAAASADVETPLRNSKTITDGLTVGEVKTYKLLLDRDVCSDPTR